jgi:hypothetical protein
MDLRSSSDAESICETSMTGIEVKLPFSPELLCTLRYDSFEPAWK